MAYNRKGSYPTEPGQNYQAWRARYFDVNGYSETGEKYEEERLQNMYWFRSQRHAAPAKSQQQSFARG